MNYITVRSSDVGELATHPELAQQSGAATELAGTESLVVSIST